MFKWIKDLLGYAEVEPVKKVQPTVSAAPKAAVSKAPKAAKPAKKPAAKKSAGKKK